MFFSSSYFLQALLGAMLLEDFLHKSSKIQSFKRLHHHEVRALGLKFRSRKEGLVMWEVDFIVLVFFLGFVMKVVAMVSLSRSWVTTKIRICI